MLMTLPIWLIYVANSQSQFAFSTTKSLLFGVSVDELNVAHDCHIGFGDCYSKSLMYRLKCRVFRI